VAGDDVLRAWTEHRQARGGGWVTMSAEDGSSMVIGQIIRQVRARKTLSQDELALRLRDVAAKDGQHPQTTRRTISRWERDSRIPQPAYRRWLAVALDLPVETLNRAAAASQGGVPTNARNITRPVHDSLGVLLVESDEAVLSDEAGVFADLASLTGPDGPLPSSLAGHVIDLDLEILIDIGEDGWARVTHRHELLNLTKRPVCRIVRELWFEHTNGPLVITPLDERDRRVVIQRIHDTANFAKFACQISPAIQPGESAVVRFTCEGGRFLSDHYWRQLLPRFTRHLMIRICHRRARRLVNCTAFEEHPDGSENSIAERLTWDYEDTDVAITLTREGLTSNQAVTLRWEVSPEPA
jgi:transcriptional regulator with XRE-family HTH domain